jgi:hypothetical protein
MRKTSPVKLDTQIKNNGFCQRQLSMLSAYFAFLYLALHYKVKLALKHQNY